MASPKMLSSTLAFRALQADSRSRAHPLLLLRYRRNELERTRYGISTGRRIGNAVIRNRLRRRLRTILRRHDPMIELGWDVLIIARPTAATASQDELELALLTTLGKADLLSATGADETAGDRP